jgi:signal peptidase II
MQAAGRAPLTGPGNTPPKRRIGAGVGIAAFVLAADIITKSLVVAHLRPGEPVHVIGEVLEFNLLRNSGAAFSFGTGYTIVFTAIALGVVIYIMRTARHLRSLGWAITLGLLLGGAMGNLGDRIFRSPGIFRGNVVDWIEVTRYWPVFNLADSAIVCGGVLTVLLALLGHHLDGTRGEHAAPASDEPAGSASDKAVGSASDEPAGSVPDETVGSVPDETVGSVPDETADSAPNSDISDKTRSADAER